MQLQRGRPAAAAGRPPARRAARRPPAYATAGMIRPAVPPCCVASAAVAAAQQPQQPRHPRQQRQQQQPRPRLHARRRSPTCAAATPADGAAPDAPPAAADPAAAPWMQAPAAIPSRIAADAEAAAAAAAAAAATPPSPSSSSSAPPDPASGTSYSAYYRSINDRYGTAAARNGAASAADGNGGGGGNGASPSRPASAAAAAAAAADPAAVAKVQRALAEVEALLSAPAAELLPPEGAPSPAAGGGGGGGGGASPSPSPPPPPSISARDARRLAAMAEPPTVGSERWAAAAAVARALAGAAVMSALLVASHAFGLGIQWAGALAGAAGIAGWGLRRGALCGSGAAAAFVVGACTLGCSLRLGATLVAFFFACSKLTAFKHDVKAAMGTADDETERAPAAGAAAAAAAVAPAAAASFSSSSASTAALPAAAGRRDWKQVLCNGGVPTVLAVAYGALAGCVDLPLNPGQAAAAAAAAGAPLLEPWRSRALTALLGGFLGYYACCMGDTWASELGVLWRGTPRLVTSGRRVRRGTNGAVSPLGLAASAAGGLFAGLVFYAAALVSPTLWVFGAQRAAAQAQWPLVVLGLAAGLGGSLVDSLLGATVQFSGYDRARRRVVGRPGESVTRICGRPWLSNNAVNLASASLTSAATAAAALRLFGA